MACWPLTGGVATDYGPSALSGTVNGASTTTNRFGQSNSAMLFDGTDDYILVGDPVPSALQLTNAFTLSAWIKPESHTNLGLVVGSQYDVGRTGVSFFVDYRGTHKPVSIHMQLGNGGWHGANTDALDLVGVWTHVVIARQTGSTWASYVNGTLVSTWHESGSTSWYCVRSAAEGLVGIVWY